MIIRPSLIMLPCVRAYAIPVSDQEWTGTINETHESAYISLPQPLMLQDQDWIALAFPSNTRLEYSGSANYGYELSVGIRLYREPNIGIAYRSVMDCSYLSGLGADENYAYDYTVSTVMRFSRASTVAAVVATKIKIYAGVTEYTPSGNKTLRLSFGGRPITLYHLAA